MIKKATNQFVRLDTDTDNNSIGQGENAGAYRYALNCRVRSSKDGNAGATENVRGNIEIENTFLPAGVNTCIGTCQDDTQGRLLFFNHNSEGNHGIYQYNEVDDSIIEVLQTTILNFSTDNLITSRVIGDFLIFTDGNNPIRQISISKAIAGYIQPMVEQQITLAKQPPHFPPIATYQKDEAKKFNYVSGKLFQFAVRYIYSGYEKTTLSPYSAIPIDVNSTKPKYSEYNYILLEFGTDLLGNDLPIKVSEVVRDSIIAVELYVRGSDYVIDENNLNNIQVNKADWKYITTMYDYLDQDFKYKFYNDGNYQVADKTDTNKLYEAIPIKANAIEVKDNRIFTAGNTEDYDNVSIDIELDIDFDDYGQNSIPADPEDYEKTFNRGAYTFQDNNSVSCSTEFGGTCECFKPQQGSLFTYTSVAKIETEFTLTLDLTSILVSPATAPPITGSNVGVNIKRSNGTIIANYDLSTSPTGIINISTGTITVDAGESITASIYGNAGSLTVVNEGTPEEYFECGFGEYNLQFDSLTFSNTVSLVIQGVSSIATKGTLKRGGTYQYALTYLDENNRYSIANAQGDVVINGTAQPENIAKFTLPFFTEDVSKYFSNFPADTYKYGTPTVKWTINHLPPIWATHYAWVRTLNTAYNRFFQWQCQQVFFVKQYKENDTTKKLEDFTLIEPTDPSFSNEAKEMYVSFENIFFYKDVNSDSVISSYIPEPNDRMRIIARRTNTPNLTPPVDFNFNATYVDLPIKAIRGNWLVFEFVGDILRAGDIIEVYTPKINSNTNVFFEIAEIFPILNAKTENRLHGKGYGDNTVAQDQTNVLPATGQFSGGDSYYRSISFIRKEITPADEYTKPYPTYTQVGTSPNFTDKLLTDIFFVESDSLADVYFSKSDDTGRISIANPNNRQTIRKSAIRFSNILLPDTQINGLSSFEPLNEKVLPIEYGSINALRIAGKSQQDGNTMLAFMTTETLSMYINEAVIKQTGNAGQLTAIADDVIASVNELQGGYGCQHPESIVGNQNYVYWYDARKGVACRYATNGLYPISNYGVSRYMLDKSLQLKIIPNFKDKRVFGGYDFIADEYILTFANTQEATELLPAIVKETIGFYEPENRWTSFYSFTPEFYGKVGTTFISFVGGKLYTHNDKQNYNRFYGVKYDSKLAYVMNEAPLNEKIYKTMVLKGSLSIEGTPPNETEEFWYAEKFETNLNQLSTLFPENYEKDSYPDTRIESAFYAPILKNELTPNVTDPIFNGELMRGEVLIVHLICKASKLCVLRFAQVGYLPSLGE